MIRTNRAIAVALIVTMLSGCGGGDASSGQSGGMAAVPAPPPPPPPPPPPVNGATDRIVHAASQSIQFATRSQFFGDYGMAVRFDGATGFYSILGPYNTEWGVLTRFSNYMPLPGEPWTYFVRDDGSHFLIRASGDYTNEKYRYFYSNMAAHAGGITAFGIPSLAGTGPLTGQVTFRGFFEAYSPEIIDQGTWDAAQEGIDGEVELNFDAAANRATLEITVPDGENGAGFVNSQPIELKWNAGSPNFVQPDPAGASSLNFPVDGTMTGPAGQELIGYLRFQYVSNNDGKTYEAKGAFLAKR